MKLLSIGIENFKEIIDKNVYYIDKTDFISEVVNEKFASYTRPRRFGKTLNMSMLYYFFSNMEKDNAYLFDGLKIAENKEVMAYQNQYPVIFITLKDMKAMNFEEQKEQFAFLVSQIIKKYNHLLNSDFLDEDDIKNLIKYRDSKSSVIELKNSLFFISHCLEKHYGQKVIILIDEYDVPLQSAYVNDYYDEMVDFLRSVFSAALKTNDSLERGVMTGCLRISKESIFTGLNNFNVYSVFNKSISSSCFGFTQKDIDHLLNDYEISQYKDKMKEWYDGYLFGNTEIYNPWSALKYVQQIVNEENDQPQSYWANTSSNELVYRYIQNADRKLHDEFERLMQGKTIIKNIKAELTYRDMDDIDNIYSFLLLTGYLKVKKDMGNHEYELIIPNKEVYEIYQQSFMNYFRIYTRDKKNELYQALIEGKEIEANKILNSILQKSISYYDNQENFYHGFLVGLFSNNEVRSNKESGDGRFDICIFPETILETAIVIECKHSRQMSSLIKDGKEGARQIKERGYIEGIKNEGYMNVVGYGISFYKKQCYITKT